MAAVSRGLLQPCDTTSRVQQDTYIPFGLAFWPGGVLENWTDINPCDVQTRDQLTQAGVKLAVYNMKVRAHRNRDAGTMGSPHRSSNEVGRVADQRSRSVRCLYLSTVLTTENLFDLVL